ncbi:MAG: zinc finger domain-containing protein [Acidobacteriaceae bacterium]
MKASLKSFGTQIPCPVCGAPVGQHCAPVGPERIPWQRGYRKVLIHPERKEQEKQCKPSS